MAAILTAEDVDPTRVPPPCRGVGGTAPPPSAGELRRLLHYLIRDRDTSYGAAVTRRLRAMGIRDRPITPRSPWQNGHVERLIGSMGCARTLHSTRIRRSIDLRRQSGVSHQSLGSAVSIGTMFGWHNR